MSNEIVVFAGDSVTDCGRRTDPEALGDGQEFEAAAGHRLLADLWRQTVLGN
ncbi:MAG TPA: hypothetical protein VGD71_11125 [Kribbella sp.]|jgi:hypothetical protein